MDNQERIPLELAEYGNVEWLLNGLVLLSLTNLPRSQIEEIENCIKLVERILI